MNIEKYADGITLYQPEKWNKKTKIKGILFDMDGLILDTEKLYTRFWMEAANALGYPMTREQALGMRSLSREFGASKLQSYFDKPVNYEAVKQKRIELMNAFIEKEGVEAKPGVFELMAYLKEKGIKTAIATSSPLERTEKYLASVGLADAFDKDGKLLYEGIPFCYSGYIHRAVLAQNVEQLDIDTWEINPKNKERRGFPII